MTVRSNTSLLIWMGVAAVLCLALLAKTAALRGGIIITTDLWFEHVLLDVRSAPLLDVFNWITLLGDASVVIGIAAIVSVAILSSGRSRSYIIGLLVTLLGAATSDLVIKALVARTRPDGLIPSTVETSYSFPSGHATAAMALYGFLAFLLCRQYPGQKKKITAITAAVILAVGFSRLYLGVHFPSDVIAGYLLGGVWVLVGIAIVAGARRV